MIHALWGQRWTRLPYRGGAKYCPNGGMGLEPITVAAPRIADECRARRGSMNGIMAPFPDTSKLACSQGKGLKGPGSAPFGGSDGLVCLFFLSRHGKYCHKGAWPSPHNVAATEIADGVRAGRGSWNSVMEQRHGPPLRTPRNGDLQARTAKGPRSSPLGAAIRSSGSPTNGSSAWSAKRDRTGREVLVARIERGC
jgi:hypothetical protein